MNEIWSFVEPYVLAIVAALGSGTIIALIARMICNTLINKASEAYNVNKIADKVADKLGGKTIDVDITSITEKRLEEISQKLAVQVGKVSDETNSYKKLLVLIGGALSHLKMLSAQEKEELVAAIRELDESFVPKQKEIIATVKLEPISQKTEEYATTGHVNME